MNEPNDRVQPTVDAPRRAGQYFRRLARFCSNGRCTVAAGDFIDGSSLGRSYFAAYCDGMDGKSDGECGYKPVAWAIHPYSGGYRRSTDRLLFFVRATRVNPATPGSNDPPIWLTEGGGVVTQHFNSDADGMTAHVRCSSSAQDLQFI